MEFFPLRSEAYPMIYAYEESNPEYKGLLKIGYTTIGVEQRVAQQYPTRRPDGKIPYRIVFSESAMYSDGGNFSDHDVHNALAKRGFTRVGGEWFRCTVSDLKAASYTGIDKHEGESVGGFDTVLTREEYDKLFGSQQVSMTKVQQTFDDLPDTSYDPEYEDDYAKVRVKFKAKQSATTLKPKIPGISYIPIASNQGNEIAAEKTPEYKPQSQTEPEPEQDYSSIAVGMKVKHKMFGDGKVIELRLDIKYKQVIVAFGTAEKPFEFPDAFKQGFLTIEE